MNIAVNVILIIAGIIIIVIKRDNLLTIWGIVGIMLLCTVVYRYFIPNDDLMHLLEQLFPDSIQYTVGKDKSQVILGGDGNYYVRKFIQLSAPIILSFLTVIFGILIDLFKSLSDKAVEIISVCFFLSQNRKRQINSGVLG